MFKRNRSEYHRIVGVGRDLCGSSSPHLHDCQEVQKLIDTPQLSGQEPSPLTCSEKIKTKKSGNAGRHGHMRKLGRVRAGGQAAMLDHYRGQRGSGQGTAGGLRPLPRMGSFSP